MTGLPPFVGAVLCGGASRRMGVDKAVLDLAGRPMALRVADALRDAGAAEVLAVGGEPVWADALVGADGCDLWLPDLHPGSGPLGGLVTAVQARPGAVVVVAACDLPDLSADLVRRLVGAVGPDRPAVAESDGHPQWAVLAVPPAAARRAVVAFDAGARALRDAAPGATLVGAGPQAGLDDLDDPAALARWWGRLGTQG